MSFFSQTFFGKYKKKKFAPARGFTLIELLLVTIIMIIMTTLILLQQQKFDSSTLLRSLGYSVALSVRQAQTYGVSVRENSPGSGTFASGYGVYFSSASPSGYILFADTNGNGQYDPGEEVQTFTINKGYAINDFCGQNNGASVACAVGGSISSLTILFKHPNPDAQVSVSSGASVTGAYIQIKATGSGATRSVTVSSTGQIVVGALNS